MRALFFIWIALLSLSTAPRAATIISQSGKFAVHAPSSPFTADAVPPGSMVAEADLLALTAERVRQALVREIPSLADAKDQISLGITGPSQPGAPIGILSMLYADGFKYRMAIPPVVDEARLVKAFINILLLEHANRGAQRGAELPAWISEGLAQQLFYSVGPKLVVDRNSTGWERTLRDAQFRTRDTLRSHPTPTFQDVTTSPVPPPAAPGEALYHSSAHLLALSLLQSPNGRQNFARFLQLLPHNWNWQTAFLQAFGFGRMLDVEKWWSLAVIEFTSRDQRQAWPAESSLRKLEELLLTRVQFHRSTNSMAEIKLVDLDALLRDPDWDLQREAIRETIAQLAHTAPHLAPAVGSLALSYRRVLQTYLQKRSASQVQPGLRSTPEAQSQAFVAEALRKLATLDARRQKLAEPKVSSSR